FKFYKSDVSRIRLLRGNQFTPPVVPFPDKPWVPIKSLRSGEIFCAKVAPQAIRPAKGRYTAICRDSSSRENDHVPNRREVCAVEEDLIVRCHGRMVNCSAFRADESAWYSTAPLLL